jgi:predicted RNase H-like HicB family nuclease
MTYAVMIERGPTRWGASVLDLPGCVAVGDSRHEVEGLIREAIGDHLAGLREHDARISEPIFDVAFVEVGLGHAVSDDEPFYTPFVGIRGFQSWHE